MCWLASRQTSFDSCGRNKRWCKLILAILYDDGSNTYQTGSAAIYGLKGKKDVSVFILHPKGRISPIQELQMTTCTDANVHNLAIEGTFDDCQVSIEHYWKKRKDRATS